MAVSPFFTERIDAALKEWLSSPTWYIDKPSENARFYRFSAALIQEMGQLDLREVRCSIEEAARTWALEYEARGGDARIGVQCERLQVLYDFFNALTTTKASLPVSSLAPVRPLPTATVPTPTLPASATPKPLVPNPGVMSSTTVQSSQTSVPSPVEDARAVLVPEQIETATTEHSHDKSPAEVPPAPKKRGGRRGREVLVEPLTEHEGGPSSHRWQAFWREAYKLYDLLMERQGVTPPAFPSPNDTEAIAAEMQRRAHEVMHSAEITGDEKRRLIGTIIDKVIPHRKDDKAVYVEIEWLK